MSELTITKLAVAFFAPILAYISAFLLQLLGLPFDSFIVAFAGAYIGEMYSCKDTFKRSALTIFGIAVITTWIGSILVNMAHVQHLNPLYGVIALVLALKKEVVLGLLDDLLASLLRGIFSKIKAFLGTSDSDSPPTEDKGN